MDNQCDRCGQELQAAAQSLVGLSTDLYDVRESFHIATGNNLIAIDEPFGDWEPADEFDLCPPVPRRVPETVAGVLQP